MPNATASDLVFRARGDYLRACVLLLLAEGGKHGYELLAELVEDGYGDADAGGLYRTLRAMEDQGLVASSWQYGASGPARRVYDLTDHGVAALGEAAAAVYDMRRRLTRFLRDYSDVADRTCCVP